MEKQTRPAMKRHEDRSWAHRHGPPQERISGGRGRLEFRKVPGAQQGSTLMSLSSRSPAAVCTHTRRPYEERSARYVTAADRLTAGGLCDLHTVADIGAGGTELDYLLRAERGWRGRYLPVDRWTGPDGLDLECWVPLRRWDWFACLEVLEHLDDPMRLLDVMCDAAVLGVVVSTPNPAVVDVLALDPEHRTPVTREELAAAGLYTSVHNFYGTDGDGICGVWYRAGLDVLERGITVPVYSPKGLS